MESLENFIETTMRAAIALYNDPKRRHLLEGEETVMGATVLLLSKYLHKNGDRPVTAATLRERELRAGAPKQRQKTNRFLGVSKHPHRAGYYVRGRDATGKNCYIGYYPTEVEAARAYDAWSVVNRPGKPTNAGTGLLPEPRE